MSNNEEESEIAIKDDQDAFTKTMELIKETNHNRVIAASKYGTTPFLGHVMTAPTKLGRDLAAEWMDLYERIVGYINSCEDPRCALLNGNDDKKE